MTQLREIKYQLGSNQWTGRGKPPQWVKDFISRGGDLQSLRVTKPTYHARTVVESMETPTNDKHLAFMESLVIRGYGQHYCLMTFKKHLEAKKAFIESLGYVVVDVCSDKSIKGQYVIFGDPLISALLEYQRELAA